MLNVAITIVISPQGINVTVFDPDKHQPVSLKSFPRTCLAFGPHLPSDDQLPFYRDQQKRGAAAGGLGVGSDAGAIVGEAFGVGGSTEGGGSSGGVVGSGVLGWLGRRKGGRRVARGGARHLRAAASRLGTHELGPEVTAATANGGGGGGSGTSGFAGAGGLAAGDGRVAGLGLAGSAATGGVGTGVAGMGGGTAAGGAAGGSGLSSIGPAAVGEAGAGTAAAAGANAGGLGAGGAAAGAAGGWTAERPFVFLSVFKWEARKGWDVLLEVGSGQ